MREVIKDIQEESAEHLKSAKKEEGTQMSKTNTESSVIGQNGSARVSLNSGLGLLKVMFMKPTT